MRVQAELPHGTQAFRELVEEYQGAVFARAFHLVGNRPDAEEVVQDVFLRVYRSIGKYRSEKPLLHWIRTITTNAARSFLRGQRRYQRKRAALADELRGSTGRSFVPPSPLSPRLLAELEKLDATTRVAVSLRFAEEMTFAEIGAELGIGESAAKMRVHRAIAGLREAMNVGE